MNRMRLLATLTIVALFAGRTTHAAELAVPNPDFQLGQDAPDGWKTSGGKGRWSDRDVLELTGSATGSAEWRCQGVQFAPGELYLFRMRARQTAASGGCVICGPSFANRDYPQLAEDWQWYSHAFRTPDKPEGVLRLGLWESKGTVQFDAVQVVPAIPVYRRVGQLDLGQGETIEAGRYVFQTTFDHDGGNFHRPLAGATATFNTDRWCFSGDAQVTYRFGLPGCPFTSGEMSFAVNYHTAGVCLAEVSRDGQQWRPLATQSGLGTAKATIPADLCPAEAIYLRLRPNASPSNLQVNEIRFEAAVSGNPLPGEGRTLFADAGRSLAPAFFQSQRGTVSLVEDPPTGEASLLIRAANPRDVPSMLMMTATVPGAGSQSAVRLSAHATLPAKQSGEVSRRLPLLTAGTHQIAVVVDLEGTARLDTTLAISVPEYYRADYGERLDGAADKNAVWWCDATWKVPRIRRLPEAAGKAARLSAARNDREAVQIVVRPAEPLRGLIAKAGSLAGPNGAVISAENIKILRVHYHFVERPSDRSSVRDWWPDALPPAHKPIHVAAGTNQPLWVLVHVPKDAHPGDYQGSVQLSAEGWSATVPVTLHVWDFTLPDRNHLETAFGLDVGSVFRYHQARSDADKRKLVEMYLQSFAEHRISPYDPTPLDPIQVKFLSRANPPRAEVDFTGFDRAMREAIEKYHFTGFSLPIQGMGGGTFFSRTPPVIERFGEDTPQYQAMFASQVRQLQDHLRAQGWLDMAYVYWFDEPEPRDYAFVGRGMERIKRYAPGIRRMLTEEPNSELAGHVDIWCPISPNYNYAAAEQRRVRGERVWWYVCTAPKAPFCGLFLDHVATDLRVWHWQTWHLKLHGTLVWATNYWTSDAAYPDKPQDPYLDPMGYVSGYGVPKGTRQYWGNGDGRFIYPPESAAVPGLSGPGAVLEPPVSSIRWEMLREGVEDFEYLWLLRERLAKNPQKLAAEEIQRLGTLLQVPPEISRGMTTFTKDPAPIYARRAAIAAAIERLQ